MPRIRVTVRTSGPFFDGSAEQALREFIDAAPYEIAGRGVQTWLGIYRPQVQHPTPYYEYLVRRYQDGDGQSRVWDGGECVYGPWLESTGSRNYPVTRFRGYKSMEKSTPVMQGYAVPVAEDLLRARFLPRMN